MIVDLHKYLIYGNRKDMDLFFAKAQEAGFLEFIGLFRKKALALPEEAKKLLAAIKIAKRHVIHPKEAPGLEPLQIADKILLLNADQERLLDEQRFLSTEIARIAVFGDFSKTDLEQIEKEGKRLFQFFCMKQDLAREMTIPPEMIFVGTDYDLDYFVTINKEKVHYPKMIEIQIDQPVGQLRERLFTVREDLARTDADLRMYCNALFDLQNGLDDFLNRYTLNLAKHDAMTPLGDALFAIEAWVPKNRVNNLKTLVSDLEVDCEQVVIESKDQIPTCIENKGFSQIGEDLLYVYDIPAHTDKDPSNWVLFFFCFFFAIIISDAGYGALFFVLALLLRKKLVSEGASAAMRRFSKLFFMLSISTMIWGILTASFFGIEIRPENPIRKNSLVYYLTIRKAEYHMKQHDAVYQTYVKSFPAVTTATDGQDFLLKTKYREQKYRAVDDFYLNIFLEISLVIGIIHLSLSFLRYALRRPMGIGWILFMVGGYLYFPMYLDATTMANFLGLISKSVAASVGIWLLGIGPAFVLLVAILEGKKLGALHELTGGIQVFSDVLSYLRLYALALAGMVLSDTVNTTLGIQMGFIGTLFIILVGHTINLVMSTMSATIHGLRLNFLEWYRYSFEGGGRLFNPLRLRKVIQK